MASREPTQRMKRLRTGSIVAAGLLLLMRHAAAGAPDEYAAAATGAEYVEIPAARPEELTPANGWPSRESYRTWTRSLGGPTCNRYSILDQINRSSVRRLKIAWTFRSGDGLGNVQCNPIVVGRTMFAPTSGKNIVALDAATGKELWRFHPESGDALEDIPARRGLLYWKGAGEAEPRIIFAAGRRIHALNPDTGRPVSSFGDQGQAEIPTAGTVAGVVWKNVLVMAGYLGDVYGYDVASGRLLWRFHTIPQGDEFGADTWANPEMGANCWGGIAMDESRGIAYVATGSPKPNFVGVNRKGTNLFGNCVIALDAATGKRLWHFQEVRHDIWDFDLPAPPNLVTVDRDGRKVDAVAQVSKTGHTLLLDRVTGKPLFPFRLRRAPKSNVPGESTAPYQPDLELPERFVKHFFTFHESDITQRTPEANAYVRKLIESVNYGTWYAPMELYKPTVYFGDNGGANWPGASFDPSTGRLYVTAIELPWIMSLVRDDDPPPAVPATRGELAYRQFCLACHGKWRTGQGMVPALVGLRHRFDDQQVMAIVRGGRGAMPAQPYLPPEELGPLLDFLMARDRPPGAVAASESRFVQAGFQRLNDQEGYPGSQPPWGTLSCLDLNTGRLAWRVPLGEYPELAAAGLKGTGAENYGGAMTTAGGLVFCTGTPDRKIRAFDADTGAELWAGDLPFDGSTTPTTYEVDGRQYVVVAAVGVRMIHGPAGDAWVAFALDDKP